MDEPTRAEIDASKGPLLLEFGSPDCGWCMAAQPRIRAALAEVPGIRHIRITDGRGQPLGRSFQVKLWPTLVFLKDGQVLARLVRPGDAADIAAAARTIVAP